MKPEQLETAAMKCSEDLSYEGCCLHPRLIIYRLAGKFGGGLNWRYTQVQAARDVD